MFTSIPTPNIPSSPQDTPTHASGTLLQAPAHPDRTFLTRRSFPFNNPNMRHSCSLLSSLGRLLPHRTSWLTFSLTALHFFLLLFFFYIHHIKALSSLETLHHGPLAAAEVRITLSTLYAAFTDLMIVGEDEGPMAEPAGGRQQHEVVCITPFLTFCRGSGRVDSGQQQEQGQTKA